MNAAAIERYRAEAVRFHPTGGHAVRVGATLLTCRAAVEILNGMRMPAEADTAYRHVNVHNPRCPLLFDRGRQAWACPPGMEAHPVFGINWAGALLMCRHIGARLPHAGEWEAFASNNDPQRLYPWGNDAPTHERANYDEFLGGTSEVGRFPPSELGLYDLAGNLCEWCADAYAPAEALPHHRPMERVVKGGAWSKDARYLRIRSSRGKWERLGTTTIGFRPLWDD